MASPRTLAWTERLAWIGIYGGLFAMVVGLATARYDAASAWSLGVAGGVLTAAGAILVWIRSRMN